MIFAFKPKRSIQPEIHALIDQLSYPRSSVWDCKTPVAALTSFDVTNLRPNSFVVVDVTTPDEYQGDLLGDINRRRGTIIGIDAKAGQTILNAHVPLAEMFGYATAIRSLSKGRASYSMEPLTFEQVPSSVLSTILDAAAKKPAART